MPYALPKGGVAKPWYYVCGLGNGRAGSLAEAGQDNGHWQAKLPLRVLVSWYRASILPKIRILVFSQLEAPLGEPIGLVARQAALVMCRLLPENVRVSTPSTEATT